MRLKENQFRPVGVSKKGRFRFRCLPPTPECIGTFEQGHQQCDGDPQAADAAARLPCVWRRYCRGINNYLLHKETEETLAELLARLTQEELALHGERWADKPGHRNRMSPRGPKLKRGVPRHYSYYAWIHPSLEKAIKIFRTHLVPKLPGAKIRAASSRLVLADVGTFYEQRGFRRDGYRLLRWYCSRGQRLPVCAWRIRVVPDGLIAVELPCKLEVLREFLGPERSRRLAVYSTANRLGRWGAQLYGLGLGLVGEAAEAVAELLLARKLEGVPWPPEPKPRVYKPWLWRRKRFWQKQARYKSQRKAEATARRKKRRGYE